MKKTEPKVQLIAQPDIDWVAIHGYLNSVDGVKWWYRVNLQEDRPGEDLVEFAGRMCYRSWKPGLNPNVTRVREDSESYLQNIVASQHGSVLEHANYTFVFQDVSRVFTHELVRHRAGCAYSQESLRYVRLDDIPFWFPEWAEEDAELMERSLRVLDILETHQAWMTERFKLNDEATPFSEKKHKTSFMRRFAPEGLSTSIVMTANIRSLRHMIEMRTAEGAEEEMRLVFNKVGEVMREKAPALFSDYEVINGEWIPGVRKA